MNRKSFLNEIKKEKFIVFEDERFLDRNAKQILERCKTFFAKQNFFNANGFYSNVDIIKTEKLWRRSKISLNKQYFVNIQLRIFELSWQRVFFIIALFE